jgi:hypothetical protein
MGERWFIRKQHVLHTYAKMMKEKISMDNQPSSSLQPTVYCTACGHPNQSWRSNCEKCNEPLVRLSNDGRATFRSSRPGCLTVYAIFLVIASVAITLLAVDGQLPKYYIAAGAIELILAVGVWLTKNWARIGVIIIQCLGAGLTLIQLCNTFSKISDYQRRGYRVEIRYPVIFGVLIGLAISIYIIRWFATHREEFH